MAKTKAGIRLVNPCCFTTKFRTPAHPVQFCILVSGHKPLSTKLSRGVINYGQSIYDLTLSGFNTPVTLVTYNSTLKCYISLKGLLVYDLRDLRHLSPQYWNTSPSYLLLWYNWYISFQCEMGIMCEAYTHTLKLKMTRALTQDLSKRYSRWVYFFVSLWQRIVRSGAEIGLSSLWFRISQGMSLGDFLLALTCPIEKVPLF